MRRPIKISPPISRPRLTSVFNSLSWVTDDRLINLQVIDSLPSWIRSRYRRCVRLWIISFFFPATSRSFVTNHDSKVTQTCSYLIPRCFKQLKTSKTPTNRIKQKKSHKLESRSRSFHVTTLKIMIVIKCAGAWIRLICIGNCHRVDTFAEKKGMQISRIWISSKRECVCYTDDHSVSSTLVRVFMFTKRGSLVPIMVVCVHGLSETFLLPTFHLRSLEGVITYTVTFQLFLPSV